MLVQVNPDGKFISSHHYRGNTPKTDSKNCGWVDYDTFKNDFLLTMRNSVILKGREFKNTLDRDRSLLYGYITDFVKKNCTAKKVGLPRPPTMNDHVRIQTGAEPTFFKRVLTMRRKQSASTMLQVAHSRASSINAPSMQESIRSHVDSQIDGLNRRGSRKQSFFNFGSDSKLNSIMDIIKHIKTRNEEVNSNIFLEKQLDLVVQGILF